MDCSKSRQHPVSAPLFPPSLRIVTTLAEDADTISHKRPAGTVWFTPFCGDLERPGQTLRLTLSLFRSPLLACLAGGLGRLSLVPYSLACLPGLSVVAVSRLQINLATTATVRGLPRSLVPLGPFSGGVQM